MHLIVTLKRNAYEIAKAQLQLRNLIRASAYLLAVSSVVNRENRDSKALITLTFLD